VAALCTNYFNIKASCILPSECVYVFRTILRIKTIISLNSINYPIFVLEMQCVSCEVVTEFFNSIRLNFIFQMGKIRLIYKPRVFKKFH
jgi:hypothetical protein